MGKKGTEIANWDEELASQAKLAAGMEAHSGGGQFFSLKGGQLSFGGQAIAGNQIAAIVVASRMENVMYTGKYDPEINSPPECYAFGVSEAEMKPFKEAPKPKSLSCVSCANNQWGSADQGKGKACKNRRRLAFIVGGKFDDNGRFNPVADAATLKASPVAYLNVPVTSVKGWSTTVQSMAAVGRPPHGFYIKIKSTPDAKSTFKVLFDVLAQVPNTVMAVIMARHKEAEAAIEFGYPEKEAATKAAGAPKAKKRRY